MQDDVTEIEEKDLAHDEDHVHADEDKMPSIFAAVSFLSFPSEQISSQVRWRGVGEWAVCYR